MADIPNVNLDSRSDTVMAAPDQMVKVREAFGIDSDMSEGGYAALTSRSVASLMFKS